MSGNGSYGLSVAAADGISAECCRYHGANIGTNRCRARDDYQRDMSTGRISPAPAHCYNPPQCQYGPGALQNSAKAPVNDPGLTVADPRYGAQIAAPEMIIQLIFTRQTAKCPRHKCISDSRACRITGIYRYPIIAFVNGIADKQLPLAICPPVKNETKRTLALMPSAAATDSP